MRSNGARLAFGALAVLTLMISFVVAGSAEAYKKIGCKWTSNPVSWRYSGSSSTIEGYFQSAAGSWNAAALDVSLVETTASGRKIEVYYANYANVSWDGLTQYNNCTTTFSAVTYVKGNSGYLAGYASGQRTGVLVHEFGHALGLDHWDYVNNCYRAVAIMYYATAGRKTCAGAWLTGPQADDKNGINGIY